MFNYGGIEMPDVEWLSFAIYNAGRGLLGSNSKKFLEDILSTVGVLLMFDDAGQEAVYLQDQITQKYLHFSTKFLHLYLLNGIYVPASFILQLTYDGLVKAESELLKEAKSKGSRANIINPISEKHSSGINTKNGRITTEQSDWESTFENNFKSVQIKITFLAGFLDIIDVLNQKIK